MPSTPPLMSLGVADRDTAEFGYVFVCVSDRLSDRLPIWLPAYLAVCLSIWLSACVSGCLTVWLSDCLAVYLIVQACVRALASQPCPSHIAPVVHSKTSPKHPYLDL